jgi:hypothetical protein
VCADVGEEAFLPYVVLVRLGEEEGCGVLYVLAGVYSSRARNAWDSSAWIPRCSIPGARDLYTSEEWTPECLSKAHKRAEMPRP